MQAVAVPSGLVRYRCRGEGPDLVLLHGLLGSSAQWEPAMALLSPGHRCWALELPGIGASTRPRDLSLAGMAVWLEQACRALPLAGGFALIGSSWGGAVALEFAARSEMAPRLRRLVLVAPAHPFWRPTPMQRFMLRWLPARIGACLGAHVPQRVQRALLERIYGDPARLATSSVTEYGAILRQPRLGSAVAGCARHFRADRRRLAAALTNLQVPTLLVWGDRDPVVPIASAAALRAALPEARWQLMPGVGHLPFAEDPEAFTAAVLPFLQ
ncbi:MAG: alpha/beta fold hydrolase [Terriglobales bacterium]